MSKRKQARSEDGSDSDVSLVDVDFEFFDPDPDVDYLALKRLVVQQFQSDAELIRANDLADLILAEPRIGSTIKCDGPESDPYAFLTVVNMTKHKDDPAVKALAAYALSKALPYKTFHADLQALLNSSSSPQLGFIFCERLINMPVQVIPPLYRMLVEEMQGADNEHGSYTHFLLVSRIYRLTAEEQADMMTTAPPTKKHKKKAAAATATPSAGGTFSFHPEDEFLQKVALHTADYSFTQAPPRDKESFGLDTGGRMMLIAADKLATFAEAIGSAYASPV